jgi:hypothetical protein
MTQLWNRTGGASDAVAGNENKDLYDSTAYAGAFDNLNRKIDASELCGETQVIYPKQNFQSTSSAITSSGDQVLVITGAVTVTLNANPSDGEFVKVKRVTTAGNVIIAGNGRNIDGDSTYTMLANYESVTLVYSAIDDIWVIV